MSRVVLFDLGNTLIDEQNHPLPGAIDLLTQLSVLRDGDGQPIAFGLLSDWDLPQKPSEIPALREAYLKELKTSGLDTFFMPLEKRVTLSTEVGEYKPSPKLFRVAIDRLAPKLAFHHVIFVTENAEHIQAARSLGMMAIQVQGPKQSTGEIKSLADVLPLLSKWLAFAPCCKKHGEAVGKHKSIANKSKKKDTATQTLLSKIKPERILKRLKALSKHKTRWTYSPEIGKVTDWVQQQFLQMGYPSHEVRLQPFQVSGAGPQNNVLCGPDKAHPGFVLLCAHYDSLSEKPAQKAPGADDNASGVAVLLEVAEVLQKTALRRGVLFASFGGEEQGLFGSAECAEIAAKEKWKIDVVINLDMIAFQHKTRPNLIKVEYDQGNRNPGNDAAAKAFGLMMAQAAADYTRLEVEHTDIWNSDYIPFEAKGYACIGVYEGGENPHYHQTTDTHTGLDKQHLAEIAKMVLATIFQIAR